MKCIKVFGVEASGTEFLIDLLRFNTDGATVFDHELGDSNGIPPNKQEIQQWFKTEKRPNQTLIRIIKSMGTDQVGVYPIILIKNPYLWYKNLNNHRGKKGIKLDRDFIIYNSTYSIYKDLLEHNKERYNKVYEKGLYINYEKLLAQPKSEINRVAKCCDISINSDRGFKIPEHISAREKNFYLAGSPWKLDEFKLTDIQTRIDWNLMQYYGYYPIDVEEAYNSQCVRKF
jgi:hypothetical protein